MMYVSPLSSRSNAGDISSNSKLHGSHVVALLNIELGKRQSDAERLSTERDEQREERNGLQGDLKAAKKRIEELRESRRLVFLGPTPRPSD